MSDKPVVIVGNGQAGFQTAVSLRDLKYGGRIVLFGDELEPPYQRPPLSKAYLNGALADDTLMLRPAHFYDQKQIELRCGERIASISRAARTVTTTAGGVTPYDHLILATGARVRKLTVPGVDASNVHYLRSIKDARQLSRRLSVAQRAVIVGAGFIGLEVASTATELGILTTVIDMDARPMARTASPEVSQFFQSRHEARGVRFRFGASISRLSCTDGLVHDVELSTGEHLPADMVLVAIGVVPNIEVAASAGIGCDDGIIVDANLRTNDPTIFAVGDCAQFPSRYGAKRMRVESIQNATDQARCAAAQIAGNVTSYAKVPWFWSDQAGVKLQIAGIPNPHDTSVVRPGDTRDAFSVFCFRGNDLVGVESVNRAVDHIHARKLFEKGGVLTVEQVQDHAFDLARAAAATPLVPMPM